jgi:hypothetical protein
MARASGWRTFKGMRASTWWSPSIVLYVVAAFVVCVCALTVDALRALSNAQECAPWENISWCLSLGTLLASGIATVLAVFSNHRTNYYKLAPIHVVDTGKPPQFTTLPDSKRWHIFLSHTWKTGQDQVLNIKQSLQALLPGVKVTLAPPFPLVQSSPSPPPHPQHPLQRLTIYHDLIFTTCSRSRCGSTWTSSTTSPSSRSTCTARC